MIILIPITLLLIQIATDLSYAIYEEVVQITGPSGGNWIAWVLTTISRLLFGG